MMATAREVRDSARVVRVTIGYYVSCRNFKTSFPSLLRRPFCLSDPYPKTSAASLLRIVR